MKYIKCIKNTLLLTAGNWYGINELKFYGAIITVFRLSDKDWVMSAKENFDIGFLSEHNPDLRNETQPITKENILKVLHNNGYNESTLEAYCELFIKNSTTYYGSVMLNNVLDWLGTVEAIAGKLKPLSKLEEIVLKVGDVAEVDNYGNELVIVKIDYVNEEVVFRFGEATMGQSFDCLSEIKSVNGKTGIYKIPEFNFDQYLLDNGFTFKRGIGEDIIYYYKDISQGFIRNGYFVYNGSAILLTPENTDKIIELAKLNESLERKI